jgi:hypothetical protein
VDNEFSEESLHTEEDSDALTDDIDEFESKKREKVNALENKLYFKAAYVAPISHVLIQLKTNPPKPNWEP